jgi:hypothetical protein
MSEKVCRTRICNIFVDFDIVKYFKNICLLFLTSMIFGFRFTIKIKASLLLSYHFLVDNCLFKVNFILWNKLIFFMFSIMIIIFVRILIILVLILIFIFTLFFYDLNFLIFSNILKLIRFQRLHKLIFEYKELIIL